MNPVFEKCYCPLWLKREGLGRALGLLCGRDSESAYTYFWSHLVGSNQCSHKENSCRYNQKKKKKITWSWSYNAIINTFKIYITLDSFPWDWVHSLVKRWVLRAERKLSSSAGQHLLFFFPLNIQVAPQIAYAMLLSWQWCCSRKRDLTLAGQCFSTQLQPSFITSSK